MDPKAQFSAWLEAVSQHTGPFCALRAVDGFVADIEAKLVGGGGLMRTDTNTPGRHATRFAFRRGKPEIPRTKKHFLGAYLHEYGTSRVTYDGALVDLRPGDWMLVTSRHPSEFVVSGNSRTVVWTFPEEDVAASLGAVERSVGRPMPAEDAINGVCAGYLRALASGRGPIDEPMARAVSSSFTELLRVAVSRPTERTLEAAQPPALADAILSYIEGHHADADIDPSAVASHFGISTRYLHRVLESTHATFSQHLLDMRLGRAHAMLVDPLHGKRQIIEIAFACGFNDVTHFARAFKRAYGITPRDARAQAARDWRERR